MAGASGRSVGRPNLEPEQRRVHKVSTYLSSAELKRLNEHLALSEKGLADWLREAISGHLAKEEKNRDLQE